MLWSPLTYSNERALNQDTEPHITYASQAMTDRLNTQCSLTSFDHNLHHRHNFPSKSKTPFTSLARTPMSIEKERGKEGERETEGYSDDDLFLEAGRGSVIQIILARRR